MKKFIVKTLAASMVVAGTFGVSAALKAAEQEQYIPLLTYRTGSFAPLGIAWGDGKVDYLELVNAQGGINGVKIRFEECETAYATDRGVECYERMKDAHGGAAAFDTQSTGITFAVTDRAPTDKVAVQTTGYGLSQSAAGAYFEWNFPLLGHYWTASDVAIQHIAEQMGGLDNLKGKKIAFVYHDSPYGKEPILLLQKRAEAHGFELQLYPVTAPGVEQKSTWLQIRQRRPDHVILWSAGVMTPTAIREAQATGYPRDKMLAIWWAGSENDVKDIAQVAKGYKTLTLHNSVGKDFGVYQKLEDEVFGKGKGMGKSNGTHGTIAYNRGMMISFLTVEAIRTAQEKYGVGKHMSPEQIRWGFENLNIDDARLEETGMAGMVRPVRTTCEDHVGGDWARIAQWDGAKWEVISDWMQADQEFVAPLVEQEAKKYAEAKGITPRDCSSVE